MNILFFDTETTGVDRNHDEIIELSMILMKGDLRHTVTMRFRPQRPITPEAMEVHGITHEDLAGCDLFKDHADALHAKFMAADVIGGYNVEFDMDMIRAAFRREGIMEDVFDGKPIVDPYKLWLKLEPRTLSDAARVFLGRDIEDAHSAEADINATVDVVYAMKEKHGLQGASWDDLSDIAFPDRKNWIGPSNHFQYVDGEPTVMFGKHTGVKLRHLDTGYAKWVFGQAFPPHVKQIMAIVYESTPATINDRITELYPRRMAA